MSLTDEYAMGIYGYSMISFAFAVKEWLNPGTSTAIVRA